MEIPKSDLKAHEEELKKDKVKYEIEAKEPEELLYKKKTHNWIYKILKLNPIDPINNFIRSILDKLTIQEEADEFQWWIAYGIWCKAAMRLFWNYRVEGPISPEHGGAVIVSNHNSHLDPFFVGGAVYKPIRWMSKKENFKTPLVTTLFKNLGAFELDRDNPDKGFETARELLKDGQYIGVFPEGTRSEDGTVQEFRTGAIRLALEMGVPIVPCAVIGSRDALPKGKLVMKPTKVTCRRGEPIYYWDYYGREVSYPEIRKLTDELRQIIIDLYEGNDEKSKELSIGYPEDMEDKPKSSGFKKFFKNIQHNILWGIDDFWFALLKSLEMIGARDAFTKPIYGFTGTILTAYTDLINPIKAIDFDKHIPKEGGALIASGHNSEWDVLMLPLAIWQNGRRQLYQMAKESLFKIPVVNAWVRTHLAFPLRRGEHDISSYNTGKDLLEAGELVVVYPEGTTNPGGGVLLEGHTGAIRLAIEAKVPIIPVGATGSENIYPKHAKMLNFGKGCIFKAGEPFMEHSKYFDQPMPSYDELKRLTNNMMAKIKDLMFYNNPNV
ncbi:MAG: lysophospholipid acyltransferase family protein [Candidatus Thorarchaeota archaeon]